MTEKDRFDFITDKGLSAASMVVKEMMSDETIDGEDVPLWYHSFFYQALSWFYLHAPCKEQGDRILRDAKKMAIRHLREEGELPPAKPLKKKED